MSEIEFNPLSGKFDIVGSGGGGSTSLERTEVEFTAGETISALKAFFIDDDGLAYLASRATYKTSKVAGIALTTATVGNTFTAVTFGPLVDVSYVASSTEPYYLHTLGQVTTTEPVSTGTLTRIGYALGVGKLFVKIEEPILRG